MSDNYTVLTDAEISEVSGGKTKVYCFEYVIKYGDTLYGLAQEYGTTVEMLCKLNKISNPDSIIAGTRIVIPCK